MRLKLVLFFLILAGSAYAQCPASFATLTGATNLSTAMDAKPCALSGAGAPTNSWCTTALVGLAEYLDTTAQEKYFCTANLTWTKQLNTNYKSYNTVQSGGSGVTQRPTINLISGTNATVTCVDNSGSSRTDCTVSATAGSATPSFPVNPQTSTYQLLAADFTNFKTITVASGTFTITAVASGSQPAGGTGVWIINYGSGVVTVARSGQNINGGTSSLVIPAGSATSPAGLFLVSDGTNYFAAPLGVISTVGVAQGGTGLTTQTAHAIYVGNGTSAPTAITVAAGVLHGGSGVDPSYSTVVAADIAANAVTSAKLAVVNTRRTCSFVIGSDDGTGISTTNIAPQTSLCYIPYAAHVVEIMINADGTSTPAVVVASRSPANSVSDMSASLATGGSGANRACANPAGSGTALDGTTTCTVALTGSATIALSAGSWIETHTSASAGSAKKLSVTVTLTVD